MLVPTRYIIYCNQEHKIRPYCDVPISHGSTAELQAVGLATSQSRPTWHPLAFGSKLASNCTRLVQIQLLWARDIAYSCHEVYPPIARFISWEASKIDHPPIDAKLYHETKLERIKSLRGQLILARHAWSYEVLATSCVGEWRSRKLILELCGCATVSSGWYRHMLAQAP